MQENSIKTALVEELIAVFSEEKFILRQLLSLSEQKKAFIISGDVSKLKCLLELEEVLSSELGELERNRTSLTRSLAGHFGLCEEGLGLSQIAEKVEDHIVRDKLLSLRDELTSMLKKQMRYNNTNKELIKRKMSYIEVMLQALGQDEPIGSTYDSKGSIESNYMGNGLFDQSV